MTFAYSECITMPVAGAVTSFGVLGSGTCPGAASDPVHTARAATHSAARTILRSHVIPFGESIYFSGCAA